METRNLLTKCGLWRVLLQSYCEVNRTVLWVNVIDADIDLRLLFHLPNSAIEQEINSVLIRIFSVIFILDEIKPILNLFRQINCTSDSLSIIFTSGLRLEHFRAQVREGSPMLDLFSTVDQLEWGSFLKELHFEGRDEEVLQRHFGWGTQRKLVLVDSGTRLTLPVHVNLKFAARGDI